MHDYYVKYADGPQRWQTPPILEELKVSQQTNLHFQSRKNCASKF